MSGKAEKKDDTCLEWIIAVNQLDDSVRSIFVYAMIEQ